MKNTIKLINALLILTFITSSCSIHADKRQHLNGYKLKITKGKNDSSITDEKKEETRRDISFPKNTVVASNNVSPVTSIDSEKHYNIKENKETLTADKSTSFTKKTISNSDNSSNKIGAFKAFKQLKKSIKNTEDKSLSGESVPLILLVILAIILPPLAVYFVKDIGQEFWISVVLTLLFWLPGIVYAMLTVLDII